jgi:hypothetical protein
MQVMQRILLLLLIVTITIGVLGSPHVGACTDCSRSKMSCLLTCKNASCRKICDMSYQMCLQICRLEQQRCLPKCPR